MPTDRAAGEELPRSSTAPLSLQREHPMSSIESMTLHRDGLAEFLTNDGRQFKSFVGAPEGQWTAKATRFEVATSTVYLHLDDGSIYPADVGYQGRTEDAPVVYLDQNHWIDLARARVGSPRISGPKKDACLRLIELARERKIILPLSSAHVVETAKVGATRRADLARTMVELSRCWQMRSPLQVRAEELTGLLDVTGREPVAHDVFTLTPNAIWSDPYADRRTVGARGAARFPEMPPQIAAEMGGLLDRVLWVVGLTETLMEEVIERSAKGDELAGRWAQHHYELAQHMRSNSAAKRLSRDVTMLTFVNDMRDDVARAFVVNRRANEEFTPWIQNEADQAFHTAPALGRLREILHLRVVNADQKWERNDLNDLLFLTAAAGYADVVVGEANAANYLRRVGEKTGVVTRGAHVFSKMTEAVEAISLHVR